MTQTFVGHFNCRHISSTEWVLRKDYEFQCVGDDSMWWSIAAVSATGLVFISLGVPAVFGIWMWRYRKEQDRRVRYEGKSPADAHRDFQRQFSYIAVRV